MSFEANVELVEAGDIDELIRHADRLADVDDWAALDDLRKRARLAFEHSGRQLWPVATRAAYRLALDAPGRWAALVLVEGTGHLGPGPLSEVAAVNHTWAELADHLTPGPTAAWFAHERVARGEDLRSDPRVPAGGPELPVALATWEPTYPAAVYDADGLHEPGAAEARLLPPPSMDAGTPPAEVQPRLIDEAEGARLALQDVVDVWQRDSNGQVRAVATRGGVDAALAALTAHPVTVEEIGATEALRALAGAAASGGAHGRRRGLARGRFEAWWVAATLAGIEDPWPPAEDEMGEVLAELRWYTWQPRGSRAGGWTLRIAIEDPLEGLAWAVDAFDHHMP